MRDILWGLDSNQVDTQQIRIVGVLSLANTPPTADAIKAVTLPVQQRQNLPADRNTFSTPSQDYSTKAYNNKPYAPNIPDVVDPYRKNDTYN